MLAAGGWQALLALGWAGACIAFDLRQKRLPNALMLAGLAMGIGAACLRPDGLPLLDAVIALLAGAAFLPAWRLGVAGGGDVKLVVAMAAIDWSHLAIGLGAGLLLHLVPVILAGVRPQWRPAEPVSYRRRRALAPPLLTGWAAATLLLA